MLAEINFQPVQTIDSNTSVRNNSMYIYVYHMNTFDTLKQTTQCLTAIEFKIILIGNNFNYSNPITTNTGVDNDGM